MIPGKLPGNLYLRYDLSFNCSIFFFLYKKSVGIFDFDLN